MTAGRRIQTVRGPIAPEMLGVTLSHEHLLIDLSPFEPGYDAMLYDELLAAEELEPFANAAGPGAGLVELTSGGIGRDPAGLRRIAEQTSVHVVMGTGWYREAVYPREVYERSTAELANLIAQDLLEGVAVSDGAPDERVLAGVIGEIGTGRRFITPAEERVFRAAARAQRRTGAALYTHTTHFGELALEQIALLREEGVAPDRIVISHLGDRRGIGSLLPIAATGVVLSIDNIGYHEYQSDEVRADNVAALVAEGLVDRIVLSTDICHVSHLSAFGGKGYDYLLRQFMPLLRARGVTAAHIRAMLIDNPRRILAMPEPPAMACTLKETKR